MTDCLVAPSFKDSPCHCTTRAGVCCVWLHHLRTVHVIALQGLVSAVSDSNGPITGELAGFEKRLFFKARRAATCRALWMSLWVQCQKHIGQINVQHRISCDSLKVENKMQNIQCRCSHTPGNLLQNLVARQCNTFPSMLKSTHIAMLSSDELHCRQSWQVNLVALSVIKLQITVKATCEHFTLFTFAKPDDIYTAMFSHKWYTPLFLPVFGPYCHVVAQVVYPIISTCFRAFYASPCWIQRFQHTRVLHWRHTKMSSEQLC